MPFPTRGRARRCRPVPIPALELVLILMVSVGGAAQETTVRRDTVYTMETIVVTADRMENRIANTTSSVSVLSSAEISRLPVTKFSDVFRLLPGFFVVDRDGLGRDPIVSARGFYGGGEAEYITVLVDGRPVNDLETGLVNWNVVPLAGAEAVEVVRGASSSLYGDASLGGVVNIITKGSDEPRSVLSLTGGSYGTLDAALKTRGRFAARDYSLFATNERTKGFRDHSVWEGTTFGGDMTLLESGGMKLRLSTIDQWIKEDVPGPLTLREAESDAKGSDAYYKFDNTDEEKYQFHLGYSAVMAPGRELTADLSYHYRAANIVRTFPDPSPLISKQTGAVVGFYDTTAFGDTKERELRDNEAALQLKYELSGTFGPVSERLLAGIDGDYGDMQNHYYAYFSGFSAAYERDGAGRGAPVVSGSGTRAKYALYLHNELASGPLTLVLGARYDAIADRYSGTMPETSLTVANTAFSPKFGLNVRIRETPDEAVRLYGSVSRSFKAPTLDQLTDQRPLDIRVFLRDSAGRTFPVPSQIPPFSNGALRPQTGVNYELGTYGRLRLSDRLSGEITAALYRMDMSDEVDFDITTYRYQNIQESRHSGFEGAVRLTWTPHLTAFANYTSTAVRFRSGPLAGNYLKGIPRTVLSAGLSYSEGGGFRSTLAWNLLKGMFLDDENTAELPETGTGSLKLSWELSPIVLSVDVENIFDRRFYSSGYILYHTTYVYPAAGRVIHGGINVEL